MKKTIYALFILISLFGCSFSTEKVDENNFPSFPSSSTEATTTYAYSASSSPNIIEIDSDVSNICISGVPKGKIIWLTKTNPTSKQISESLTRYVTTAKNISLSKPISLARAVTDDLNNEILTQCRSLCLNAELSPISQSRTVTNDLNTLETVEVKDYSIGDSKSLYVDIDSNLKLFLQKQAKLRAKGSTCYVWVVDEKNILGEEKYWTDQATLPLKDNNEKINSEIAQKIADNFDKIYPMVRNIFGNESDKIIAQQNLIYNYEDFDLNSYCDTGTKINIVVYDIGNNNSKDPSNSAIGYFHTKDYYYKCANFSNGGKYIYIDSYYAANKTGLVYSTLAHEFQHMIDFSIKTIGSKGSLISSTWYNEMKSMLCEDVMKNYLKEINSDFTDDESPFQRLPMFCRHYYDVGLEYRTGGNNEYYSYANNYAFGAWAARNYGGLSFIKKIATNNYVDLDSITTAAGDTIENMLKKYSAACVINKEGFGFQKSVTQTDDTINGYSFPLDSINLWGLRELLIDSYKTYKTANSSDISAIFSFEGPVSFTYNSQNALRPYGFTLTNVGTATDSEVILNLNKTTENSHKTYIIIE